MVLGTTAFLNRQPDFAVQGSATDPQRALALLAASLPDLVTFELSINGPYDFPFLTLLRRTHPLLPILAYSYHEEVIFSRRALDAGANGYLMKDARPDDLAAAIRQILAGDIYLSDRVKTRIEREKRARREGRGEYLNGALVNSLTIRELQIFQFLGEAFSPARIQGELGLTSKALYSACYRMRRKLGLNSFAGLVQFACHWAYYEGDFS